MLNTALSVLVAALWVAPLAAVQAPRPVMSGSPVTVTTPTPTHAQGHGAHGAHGSHGGHGGSARPVRIQGNYHQSRPVVVAPPVYYQPRYVYPASPVWVEGTWQWSQYGWVWQAGYWSQPAPAPVCAPPPPRCGTSIQFTWGR